MAGYVTYEDILEIEQAATFEELRDIAFRIITRMPQPLGMVCGPITTGGKITIEENLAAIKNAIVGLRVKGENIFDQTLFERSMRRIKTTAYFQGNLHLLKTFYRPLFESGLVKKLYFLPDWSSSVGARWEHNEAERLGIEIQYL